MLYVIKEMLFKSLIFVLFDENAFLLFLKEDEMTSRALPRAYKTNALDNVIIVNQN